MGRESVSHTNDDRCRYDSDDDAACFSVDDELQRSVRKRKKRAARKYMTLLSMAPAQLSYPVVGPIALIAALTNVHGGRTATERWSPFLVSTACLVPVVGGIVAAEIYARTTPSV